MKYCSLRSLYSGEYSLILITLLSTRIGVPVRLISIGQIDLCGNY